MSSVDYFRLALLQHIHYQQQMDEYLRVKDEIRHLKEQIASRHKKHRRCDKEINKEFKVIYSLFSAHNAKKYMLPTLPSSFTTS